MSNKNPNRKGRGCSNKEIIDDVKRIGNLLNKSPSAADFQKYSQTISLQCAIRRFGNWISILKMSGYKIEIIKQDLIDELLRIYKKLKRTPTGIEFTKESKLYHHITIMRLFGSWNKFIEESGLPIVRKHFLTKEDIKTAIIDWAKKNNNDETFLTQSALRKARRESNFPYSIQGILNIFKKSWPEVIKECGLDYVGKTYKPKLSNEEILNELIRVAAKLNRSPKTEELNKLTNIITIKTICKKFGSWKKALELAGLNITNEDIINDIKRISFELNRQPKIEDFNKLTKTVSIATIYSRFGSWKKALELAKLNITNEDIINDIKRISFELGHQPKIKDFKKLTKTVSIGIIYSRFGSWEKVLELANGKF